MVGHGYSPAAGAVFVGGGGGGGGQTGQIKPVEPPRTLASAVSRMEGLNGRLEAAEKTLSGIAAEIGAHYGIGDAKSVGAEPSVQAGVVHRLNGAADYGHSRLTEIESLIASIQRALG